MDNSVFVCSNCGKTLLKGDKNYSEKTGDTECSECRRRKLTGTRTIKKYNQWLKKGE